MKTLTEILFIWAEVFFMELVIGAILIFVCGALPALTK